MKRMAVLKQKRLFIQPEATRVTAKPAEETIGQATGAIDLLADPAGFKQSESQRMLWKRNYNGF